MGDDDPYEIRAHSYHSKTTQGFRTQRLRGQTPMHQADVNLHRLRAVSLIWLNSTLRWLGRVVAKAPQCRETQMAF